MGSSRDASVRFPLAEVAMRVEEFEKYSIRELRAKADEHRARR